MRCLILLTVCLTVFAFHVSAESIPDAVRRIDSPVSMSGVIKVRVSGEAGAIEPGDLLTPSSVPGVGMRAADPVPGTVFGKTLEPWSGAGEGLVLMLVMNR